jgi:predicted small lipoprotein YifL
MRRSTVPGLRGSIIAAATLAILALTIAGCGAKEPVKTTVKPTQVATESVTPTATVVATTPVTPAPAPAKPAEPAAPKGPWPAKVGTFSVKFKGQVWYPTKLPAGMKVDSLDVLEFEPGSGLVCDIVFLAGENEIDYMQGSAKTREFDIVSIGKVPWGTATADVVYEDPEDTTSPKDIIYNAKGTLCELYGGSSFEELKAVAASMVLVK